MVYWDVGDGVVRCRRPGMSRGGRAGTLVALAVRTGSWYAGLTTTGHAGWVAPPEV